MTAAADAARRDAEVRAGAPGAQATVCPFCGARSEATLCLDCGRDKTAARRVCTRCHANTPLEDPVCQACGQRQASDLRWKVPLIVALFAAAFAAAVLLQLE